MSFDAKCYDLAEWFLPNAASDTMKNRLAQVIQDNIEQELESMRDEKLLSRD